MPTLFSLIIGWLVATISGLVLVPYWFHRHEDSWWSDGRTILFWTALAAVSTAHGAFAHVLGVRKGGGRVGDFLLGALLMPIGIAVVMLRNARRPDAPPAPQRGVMRRVNRFFFMLGNVWWGISLLAVMFVAFIRATIYESQVGELGNQAAYAGYYNSWWIGALDVLFFVTLYCATMRKYPFRVSQIGWLCTHTGLLTLVIGCLVMHWGSFEGTMQILEGETSSAALSRNERELEILIERPLHHRQVELVEVDRDPARTEVSQVIPVRATEHGVTHELEVEIDRFLARAEPYTAVVPHRSPDAPQAAAQFEVIAPNGSTQPVILLEGAAPTQSVGGMLGFELRRVESSFALASLVHRHAADDPSRGELVVRGRDGAELAVLPVTPGARGDDPAQGAALAGEAFLPGGARVRLRRYYSTLRKGEQGFVDETPGRPRLPGIELEIELDGAIERHSARADGLWFNDDTGAPRSSAHDVVLEYRASGSDPLPPSSIVAAIAPGDRRVVVTDASGRSRFAPTDGETFAFSADAPIRVRTVALLDDARIETGWRASTGDQARGAIHVVVRKGESTSEAWLPRGSSLPERMRVGGTDLSLRYVSREVPLGFGLSVLDFRHLNYPNSSKPRVFETNVALRDPEAGVEELVLVDMNHPLSHRGFRFFNSNPIADFGNRRGIVFAVATNPGLPLILLGASITTVGLVLVFFFKPWLRRLDARRAAMRARSRGTSAATARPQPQGA